MSSLSLGERLLGDRSRKQADHVRTGTIECNGGTLTVRYRPLSYREDRKIGQRHAAIKDEVEREVRMAAETLAIASIDCVAEVGDEKHELPGLGLELAAKLGLEGAENDRQVVLMLFPSERAMVEECVAHERWTSAVNSEVDDDIAKNSGAAT